MFRIVEVKELEAALKNETSLNVKTLHRLNLDNDGDKKNRQNHSNLLVSY